jgi:hypothetical protein
MLVDNDSWCGKSIRGYPGGVKVNNLRSLWHCQTVVWNVRSKCDAFQWNSCSGWLAMIKMNTALQSALGLRCIMHKESVPPGLWMGTSVAMFWGCTKTSSPNVHSSGTTIPGPCTITMRPPTSLLGWQLLTQTKTRDIPQPPYSPGFALFDSFIVSKIEIEVQGRAMKRPRPNCRK